MGEAHPLHTKYDKAEWGGGQGTKIAQVPCTGTFPFVWDQCKISVLIING